MIQQAYAARLDENMVNFFPKVSLMNPPRPKPRTHPSVNNVAGILIELIDFAFMNKLRSKHISYASRMFHLMSFSTIHPSPFEMCTPAMNVRPC